MIVNNHIIKNKVMKEKIVINMFGAISFSFPNGKMGGNKYIRTQRLMDKIEVPSSDI